MLSDVPENMPPERVADEAAKPKRKRRKQHIKKVKVIPDEESQHGHDDPCRFECSNCKQMFNNEQVYLGHKNTCNVYTCDHCDRKFHTLSGVRYHMKVAHAERTWSCETCPRSFATQNRLQDHVITIHGDRPYKCQICDKAFGSELHLTKHAEVHEVDPIPCEICGHILKGKKGLRKHMRVHSNHEKPFKCDQCHSRFSLFHNLTTHKRNIHTAAAPLQCTFMW